MNKWVKIGLGVLVAVGIICAAFFGAAWGGGKNMEDQRLAKIAVSPAPPPVDTTASDKIVGAINAVGDKIAKAQNSQNTTTPVVPQPVTVTVNPPVVNVTVTQTVNGIATENQSSSQNEPSYPYGLRLGELEGLVYAGNFNIYKGTIKESVIDHNWGWSGPFDLTRFSIKWRGAVWVEEAGYYRFTVRADDRVRLYIDDACLIDRWTSPQSATDYTADIQLTEGSHKIILKYFNDVQGDSVIKLSYQRIS
jgi:hypothetical protein